MPKWIIEDAPTASAPIGLQQEPATESYGQRAKRTATATGVGALQNIENLFTALPQYLLGKPAPFPTPVEQIKQSYNLTPEYLEPQGPIESTIQRFGSQAPAAALLGGGLGLKALGVGTAAAAVPTALGYPKEAQDITQLATELPYALYKGVQSGRIPTAKSEQKAQDILARQAVKSTESYGADAVTNAMGQVAGKLETEVNSTLSGKIREALEKIQNNILGGKLNPTKAMDLRKSLYKLGRKLSPDEAANYIEPLTKSIKEFFTTVAIENPAFYKALDARDKLTTLRHMGTYLDKAISYLDLGKIPGGRAATDAINFFLEHGEKFFRTVGSNAPARKLYFKMAAGALNNQPLQVIRYANQLNQKLPEDLQLPQSTAKSQWVIE